MSIKGIDCVTRINSTIAADLVRSGYKFVCRYMVPEGFTKRLTAPEAKIISSAGMDVLCVFETTAARASAGASAGKADGAAARKEAEALNMPIDGIIYFAVDFDAQPADMDAVEAYLKAARQETLPYLTGVYGSYAVVEEMFRRSACVGFWQTYAWSYGKLSKHAQVYQYKNNQTAAGISVDFNESFGPAGMWNYKAKPKYLDNTPADWEKSAVEKALSKGLKGNENGDLRLHEPLTLAHALVVLERLGVI